MTELPGRPLPSFPACLSAALCAATLGLVACDRTPPPAPPGEAEPPSTEPADPVPTPEAAPATRSESEPNPDPEDAAPKGALLELKESADGKTITVTGHLSSEYQVKDLSDNLKFAFPDLTIVNEVKFAPGAQEVVWGNRVTDLLIPLINSVEEAHFHYENGITTLGGTVEDRGLINQIEKMTSYVMEADDSRGTTNNLKVKQP